MKTHLTHITVDYKRVYGRINKYYHVIGIYTKSYMGRKDS